MLMLLSLLSLSLNWKLDAEIDMSGEWVMCDVW